MSFTFPASPSKVVTLRPAHSASAASSVKSSRPAAVARRCASSRAAKPKACGVCTMRRRRAVDRAGHVTCRVDGLDGVGHGDHRHRRAARARGRDRARDQGVRGKRPRRIVHQHEVRAMALQCLEAGAHGGLPRSAAVDRRQGDRGPRPPPVKSAASSGWMTGWTAEISRCAATARPGSAGSPARPGRAGIAWANRRPRAARGRLPRRRLRL